MISFLKRQWQNALTGLWFVPTCVAVLLLLAAIGLTALDRALGGGAPLAYGGDATAARDIVVTIAGSIMSVTALVFSITIVTFQLVAAQYTPRALREFLSDRLTQFAAGGFIGTVAFCLWVLAEIRVEDNASGGFVPGLSVTMANVLGIGSLGLLIVFIHHVAQMIQVSNITARIHQATERSIANLYPEMYGEPAPELSLPSSDPGSVQANRTGFVQRVVIDEMIPKEERRPLFFEIRVRVGAFVTEGTNLVAVWPAEARDEDLDRRVRGAIVIDSFRDVAEDPAFGLQQLADIALKATSPGINDPSTAVTAIGYLRSLMEQLAGRALPASRRLFRNQHVEIVARQPTFEEYQREAFVHVALHAASYPRVASALLEAIESVSRVAARNGGRERVHALRRAAEEVALPAIQSASNDEERRRLKERFERVVAD